MNTAVVYHWWIEKSDRPPHLNHRTPLVHSIATLRGVNKEIPIIVIDISEEKINYHNWDKKLNFHIVRRKPILKKDYSDKAGWKNLSRTFDIWNLVKGKDFDAIIYCDSDVFWLKDPLPLDQNADKFCFNGYNSGFYYFKPKSKDVERYFKLFQAYTLTSLNDENFRIITRSYTDYNEWYYVLDETIMTYMYHKMPELFNMVTVKEHLVPSCNKSEFANIDIKDIKMFHLHGTIVENNIEQEDWRKKHNRGLAVLLIDELRNNAIKAIGIKGIQEIFEKEYQSVKTTSMYDPIFIKRFLETKEKGMFNLVKAI